MMVLLLPLMMLMMLIADGLASVDHVPYHPMHLQWLADHPALHRGSALALADNASQNELRTGLPMTHVHENTCRHNYCITAWPPLLYAGVHMKLVLCTSSHWSLPVFHQLTRCCYNADSVSTHPHLAFSHPQLLQFQLAVGDTICGVAPAPARRLQGVFGNYLGWTAGGIKTPTAAAAVAPPPPSPSPQAVPVTAAAMRAASVPKQPLTAAVPGVPQAPTVAADEMQPTPLAIDQDSLPDIIAPASGAGASGQGAVAMGAAAVPSGSLAAVNGSTGTDVSPQLPQPAPQQLPRAIMRTGAVTRSVTTTDNSTNTTTTTTTSGAAGDTSLAPEFEFPPVDAYGCRKLGNSGNYRGGCSRALIDRVA